MTPYSIVKIRKVKGDKMGLNLSVILLREGRFSETK